MFRRRCETIVTTAVDGTTADAPVVDAAKSDRRTFPVENSSLHKHPLSVTRLRGATELVRRVVFLPEAELVLTACNDHAIRVYDVNSDGEPLTTFKRHRFPTDVAQLDGDMVASVAWDGWLFSWWAKTGKLIGKWENDHGLTSLAKV